MKPRLTSWMLGVGVVTFRADLLFGYDQGVISSALRSLEEIQGRWVVGGDLMLEESA